MKYCLPSINLQMDIILKTRFLILKIVLKTPATCLWPLGLQGCLTEIIVATAELTLFPLKPKRNGSLLMARFEIAILRSGTSGWKKRKKIGLG